MNKLLKIKWLLVAGILAIQAPAAPGQEVSPDYGNYDSGEEIIVTFSEGPGNPKDWVGLYKQDMVAERGRLSRVVLRQRHQVQRRRSHRG